MTGLTRRATALAPMGLAPVVALAQTQPSGNSPTTPEEARKN